MQTNHALPKNQQKQITASQVDFGLGDLVLDVASGLREAKQYAAQRNPIALVQLLLYVAQRAIWVPERGKSSRHDETAKLVCAV